jgi:hypothetical protein
VRQTLAGQRTLVTSVRFQRMPVGLRPRSVPGMVNVVNKCGCSLWIQNNINHVLGYKQFRLRYSKYEISLTRMDKKQIASDLRLEASRLEDEAKQLQQAADVLDPAPRQMTLTPASIGASVELNLNRASDDDRPETVVDIVVDVLRRRGAGLHKEELFELVRSRGGRVKSIESLSSALSRAKDKVGFFNGLWDLPERACTPETEPPSYLTDTAKPTVEEIAQFLRQRHARVREVARHFRTTEDYVRALIADKKNGLHVNGPGWLLAIPSQSEPQESSNSGGRE